MAKVDVWPTVHAERRALADDLEGLDDAAWATASLCDGWTVRDVVAHMTATSKITTASFFPRLLASGFSLKRLQRKDIVTEKGASPADTLARFRSQVDATGRPPGPVDTPLGETLVHAEDIRRPLGIAHRYPPVAVAEVADFYRSSNLVIGGKRRSAGLRWQATDADWCVGDGPVVSGPVMSLLLAIAGRSAALDDLTGDGLDTLRSRT